MDDDRFREDEQRGRQEMHEFWLAYFERMAQRREDLARRYRGGGEFVPVVVEPEIAAPERDER